MASSREVLIMVAPNGARLGKAEAPNVPLTPQELAAEAEACHQAGAAAMHVHVRDAQGGHSLDAAHYEAALTAIRRQVGQEMILQITTEAAGRYEPAQQMQVVRDVRPESVSIALRELLPEDADAVQAQQAKDFFRWLAEERLGPQMILYAPQEVERLAALREEGVVPWRNPFLLFVLGRYGGQQAAPAMLDAFLKALEGLPDAVWMACAFGQRQIEVLEEAARLGGHVRIGFENGRWLPNGREAGSNAELVAALAERLRVQGATPMAARQARALLQDTALIIR